MITLSLEAVLSSASSGYWGKEPGTRDSDVRVIRNGDVQDDGVRWDALPLRGFTNSEVRRSAVRKGDLLLTTSGDCGRIAMVESMPTAQTCASNFVRCLRFDDRVLARYAFHYMRTQRFRAALEPFIRGAVMKNLSTREAFSAMQIPIPPLDEQRRIAAILDQADAIRTKRRQTLAHLDTLTQSIFHTMFGDLAIGESTVGDVGTVQGGLQVSSKRSSLPIAVPYLRVANVHRGRLDLTEVKRLRATRREIERTTLLTGDLLVVEGHANPMEIGRVAVWTGEVGGCVHQNHLIRIRFDERTVLPSFASHWLNSARGAAQFRRAGKTTSGLNTISTSTVRTAPLPIPPLEVQHEFAARSEAVTAQRVALERALTADDELFASLQSRAFRGEL